MIAASNEWSHPDIARQQMLTQLHRNCDGRFSFHCLQNGNKKVQAGTKTK
jgi:hypothetical protein